MTYRVSIYNGFKIIIENTICRFGTYCGFSSASEAYYNIENYKPNDTLEILILPPGLPKGLMRGLVLNKFYRERGIHRADFTNYHLINIETKDTIPIVTRPINDVLLISTVIHEKGNYLLKGSFTLLMDNNSFMNLYTTNELIQVK